MTTCCTIQWSLNYEGDNYTEEMCRILGVKLFDMCWKDSKEIGLINHFTILALML